VPVWQRIYEEINDPNFVILCAAEDVGGEAVAGPIFDAANATYIQVVDPDHIISSAFNFVNVPSAAWVDEEGRIVRIDEGTYSQQHEIGDGDHKISFGTDVYSPALKDWIAKGPESVHVQSAETVTGNIRQHTPEQLSADAAFRLGNLFREHGHSEKAEHYWQKARELNPDSVNFIRQNLTLTAEGSAGESFMKLMGEYINQGKDYYRPLDIES
jgi:tetratricopeptide (TPR) repeat protein